MSFNARLLILVSTLLVVNCGSTEDSSYIPASHFIVTSGAVIPNKELVVHVSLLKTTATDVLLTDGRCTLNVSSAVGDLVVHQESWTFEPGMKPEDFSKTFRVMADFDVDEVRNSQSLRIESSGCLQFNYSSEVPVALEDMSIAIQTDKDVYQPGDLVMFRVFSQLSNWKAYQHPLDIIVTDSRGEVVVVWSDMVGTLGVISQTYFVPQMIEDGQWIISVRTLFDKTHNKTIDIITKGYESFVVKLDAPRYQEVGLDHEALSHSIDVRVLASRFSGLPVVGIVTLKISLMNSTHSTTLPSEELENGLKKFNLDLNELKSQMKLSEGHKWLNKTILVSAKVEESFRRSSVVVESASIEFMRGVDLNFHPFTPGVYKPGWETVGWISIKSKSANFLPVGPPKKVTLKITHNPSSADHGPWNEMIAIDIGPSGVGRFAVETKTNDASLELQAYYDNKELKEVSESEIFKIVPFDADDDHFLQVTLVNESPVVKSGQMLSFRVKTTFPSKRLNIEVFSQKLLVLTDTRDFPSASTNRQMSLSIPHDLRQLLATSRLVVWSQSPTGEIVSDSLLFVVEETRKKVQLIVKPELFEVEEEVEIEIKASPNSIVYLFATATPPIFQDAEQEKENQIALEKMKRYTESLRSSYLSDVLTSSCKECSTIPSLNSDSMKVFKESHGLVFGTSNITNKPDKYVHTMLYRNILEKDRISLEFDPSFWKSLQIGSTGAGKVKISVQARLALYTISAVSIQKEEGFNLAEPVQVRMRGRVLADILYPERVVEGESFNVEIGLFKQEKKKSNVDVWFKVDPPLEIICNNDVRNASKVYQVVQLSPKESKSVFFHVKATSTPAPGTQIESLKFLKVEESSNVNEERKSMMIVDEIRSLSLAFNERSTLYKSTLTIYGDIMGPAVEYALRSIEHPNVVDDMTNMRLAITTHTLDYLRDIDDGIFSSTFDDGNLDEAGDVERLTDSLWTSIQHVFHRQHADGFFLSPRSIHGPIRCTSFMLEAMLEWKSYSDLDKSKMVRAAKWLIEQQQEDGSFSETFGRFRAEDEEELKSQTVRLTCHVLLSFIQSYKMYKDKKSLDEAISKSYDYLEARLFSGEIDGDGYALSMLTYSLTILNTGVVQETRERQYKLQEMNEGRPPLEDLRQESLEIETSAYDLLTHLSLAELKDAKSVANWLVQRMGPDGRFASSDATMVALKALSRYSGIHKFHNTDSQETSVELKYSNGRQQQLTTNGVNSIHRIAFDKRSNSMIDDLEVNVVGGGILLCQLESKYDESLDPRQVEAFHLNHSISEFEGGHQLNLCMEWMPSHSSGPVMVEVPVLSGLTPHMESNRKMLEEESKDHVVLQEGVVYVALNEFERGQSKCLKLNFIEEDEIVGRKEKFIQVYSRLNMNKRSRLAYHDGHDDQTPEDVCPSCDCNVSRGSSQRPDTVIIIIQKQRRA